MKFDLTRLNWYRVALIILGAVFLLCLSSWVSKVFAADATVIWTHPTLRIDGTALPGTEIKETVISWGLDVPNPTFPNEGVVAYPGTEFRLDIAANKWCFRAATRDVDNLQSDWTGPVCVNLRANPNKPIIISISRAPL